jgi:hypothetical protein
VHTHRAILVPQLEDSLAGTRRVVGAFVTFRNEAAKVACLRATPNSWIRQLLLLKAEHKFRGTCVARVGRLAGWLAGSVRRERRQGQTRGLQAQAATADALRMLPALSVLFTTTRHALWVVEAPEPSDVK